ncbi:MAG: SPOR domain-containing protein [Gammaproteobacteria bacterium]
MERPLKQRLVGAAVLVGLAVIFVPMLVERSPIETPRIEESNIPAAPATAPSGEFTSKIVPLEPVEPVTPVVPPSAEQAMEAAAPTAPPAAGAGQAATAAAREGAVPRVPPSAVDDGGEPAPAGADQRAGVNAWVIQLGSFASEQNARDLEARLQKEGYAAFVEKIGAGEEQKFRVRVGPELLRAKADQAREKLEKELNLKGIVVRYP